MTDTLPAWSEPFHVVDAVRVPRLLHDITLEWAYGDRSGRGVRVAIIDSGIDARHPDVGHVHRSKRVELDPEIPGGVRFHDEPHVDVFGHGTACAAIVRQLAPEVDLISVRVLGDRLTGRAAAVAHGLRWCIDEAVDVVNLSLSTANEDFVTTFHDLIDEATYAGTMVVAAMNNEPRTTIPGEFAGVFSVASAPGTDRERVLRNPDAPAEWGAAGIDVEVAWLDGGSITASGNSFATPIVTGHLARIAGAHPGVTPWQAHTILAELAGNAR